MWEPSDRRSEALDRYAGLRDLGNFSLDLVTANPSRQSQVIFFSPLLAAVPAGAYSSVRVGMVRTETVCRA